MASVSSNSAPAVMLHHSARQDQPQEVEAVLDWPNFNYCTAHVPVSVRYSERSTQDRPLLEIDQNKEFNPPIRVGLRNKASGDMVKLTEEGKLSPAALNISFVLLKESTKEVVMGCKTCNRAQILVGGEREARVDASGYWLLLAPKITCSSSKKHHLDNFLVYIWLNRLPCVTMPIQVVSDRTYQRRHSRSAHRLKAAGTVPGASPKRTSLLPLPFVPPFNKSERSDLTSKRKRLSSNQHINIPTTTTTEVTAMDSREDRTSTFSQFSAFSNAAQFPPPSSANNKRMRVETGERSPTSSQLLPTISKLWADCGRCEGGTPVTIFGANLHGFMQVAFGENVVPAQFDETHRVLHCFSPPHNEGVVPVGLVDVTTKASYFSPGMIFTYRPNVRVDQQSLGEVPISTPFGHQKEQQLVEGVANLLNFSNGTPGRKFSSSSQESAPRSRSASAASISSTTSSSDTDTEGHDGNESSPTQSPPLPPLGNLIQHSPLSFLIESRLAEASLDSAPRSPHSPQHLMQPTPTPRPHTAPPAPPSAFILPAVNATTLMPAQP